MAQNDNESVIQWVQNVNVPAALVAHAHCTIQGYFAKELAPYHIGWSHYAILMSLYELDGRSPDNPASPRGYDKATTARSAVKLEKEGLIRRVADPANKRVKHLYLTEKGRALQPAMVRVGKNPTESLLKGFSPEEASSALESIRKIGLNASKL